MAGVMKCLGCDRNYRSCDCERAYRGVHTNGLPIRILDVLETEGGWETPEAITERLKANRTAVDRALLRLEARGLIERRRVELAGSLVRQRNSYHKAVEALADYRTEWRLA
jgi:DNA-binding MarR family transcriptional regulator